ncbi:hypothetical protein LINGRAHAP2_LOCUS3977 [Linum grandiflorum]
MVDLWQPGYGVNIKQIDNKLIISCSRHIIDLRRVLFEGPWHFNMHLLILQEIQPGQTPQEVSLRTTNF